MIKRVEINKTNKNGKRGGYTIYGCKWFELLDISDRITE